MKLLIAGDFYIADNYKNKNLIDQSVVSLFENADYRIINQECPITVNIAKNKILKTGPHLRASEETVLMYLKQLKVDLVTLANNHIMDYGAKGLIDTLVTLNDNYINHVGAGTTEDASKYFTIEKDGLKIAILNFAENEWSTVEMDEMRATPLDIIDNVIEIKKARATHDKVICIIHGGHEYYQLPSPRMIKQYRFYADNGVDAIVGHHTHCFGGYEVYKNIPIIYSLGNFLFTRHSRYATGHTGLLVQLEITKDKPIVCNISPILSNRENFLIYLPRQEQKNLILQKVAELNEIIAEEKALQQHWDSFIKMRSKYYLNTLSPINMIGNRYLRGIINKLGLSKLILNTRYLKSILNLIRCESHNDLVTKTILNEMNKGIKVKMQKKCRKKCIGEI